MSLINPSFFIGEINIANLDSTGVEEELIRFINIYEGKFLESVLGYEPFKQFNAGLALDPVPQKWIDLLIGAEYTHNGRLNKFKGLIEDAITGSSLNGYDYKSPVVVQTGVTTGFPAGVNTVTVSGWVGYEILAERNGFGTMKKGVDYNYNKLTGKWDLLGGNTFQQDEYYTIQFIPAPNTTTVAVSTAKKSPIANYVYFYWMRNNASSTTGVGEVANTTDNSKRVNVVDKSVRAWNEMVDMLIGLYAFMQVNSTVYNWSIPYSFSEFQKINAFGI